MNWTRTPSPSVEATPAARPPRAPASPVINLAVRCVHPAPPEPLTRTCDRPRPRLRRPSSICANAHLFRPISTGKERDTESGNDYFGARYYSSSMGRFLSPDWSAKVEPVPYAKLDDPQSLNLYSYVRNNPLIRIDSNGHDAIWLTDSISGQVTLIIPVHFSGSGATADQVQAIVERDNSLDIGGSPVKILVVATDKPIDGVLNEMDFSPGYNSKCGSAGECVMDGLGGSHAHIDSRPDDSTSAAAHDILHFAGIKDQYTEGKRDANGNRTNKPKPGFNNSNIMTSRKGKKLKPEQIQEAKKNGSTKHCSTVKGKQVCTWGP